MGGMWVGPACVGVNERRRGLLSSPSLREPPDTEVCSSSGETHRARRSLYEFRATQTIQWFGQHGGSVCTYEPQQLFDLSDLQEDT